MRVFRSFVAASLLVAIAACSNQTVQNGRSVPQATQPVPPSTSTGSPPPSTVTAQQPAITPAPPPPTSPAAPVGPPVDTPAPSSMVPPTTIVGGSVRVALLLPLSGREAALGKAMLDAAQLGVFDFGDDQFTLLPVDTEASGALAAAQTALDGGAQLILGPLFSKQVAEVARLAASRSINVLSFSNDSGIAGGNVYVLGLPPGQAIRRAIDFAHVKGATAFAGLLPDDVYGGRLADVLRQEVQVLGGTISRLDRYPASTTDFTQPVRTVADFEARRDRSVDLDTGSGRTNDAKRRAAKLATTRDVDYQALVIAESGQRLRNMAALIPYFDIDTPKIRLLGPNSWEDATLGREPALVGAWFGAPDPAARQPFEERFKAAYLRAPPRLASLAYDATGLAAVLARTSGQADFSAAALHNPSGFSGVDGVFRFGDDNVIERGLAVIEIGARALTVVDPAPVSFQPPTQ